MTSVVYHPTPEDLLDAARLHHLSAICSRRILGALCGFAVALGALAYAASLPAGDSTLAVVTTVSILLLALIVLMLRQLVLPRLLVRRVVREQPNLRHDFTLAWTEHGYEVTSQKASSSCAWDQYIRWRENKRVILLYVSRETYQCVPKHALPAGAGEFIQTKLQGAGVPKKSWFLS